MRYLWLVVALAACGSETESKQREKRVEKSKDVAPLFTGATVTLPPEVAKATFGMPEEEVQKATGARSTYLSSPSLDRVSYQFELSHNEKKLEKISASTSTPLEPLATKQWGAPVKTAKGVPFWFDPKTGLRAWLPEYAKGTNVSFSRYDSLESLLGPTGFSLAFAQGKPLIGASLDELHAAWDTKLCDFTEKGPKIAKAVDAYRTEDFGLWHDAPHELRLCMSLPRLVSEGAPYGDYIEIGRMGKVEEIRLELEVGGAQVLIDQAIKFLDAKFGTPVVLTDSTKNQVRWYFDPATKQRANARFTGNSILLSFGRYTPVASLLAADAPGVLSVATKSMPGGTAEAIQKEDPEHFNAHGTLAQLVFPASDFGYEELEIDLEHWAHETKTYSYRTVFHHTDNEAAGDAVFALLEAKLGKAKKDAKSTDTDVYYNWRAKNGNRVVGRRVSQQWQIEVLNYEASE